MSKKKVNKQTIPGLSVEEKVRKGLESLDVNELMAVMSEMTAAMLTGKDIEYVDSYIRFTIPKGIHDLIKKISDPLEINPEEILSKMASDGFNKQIQSLAGFATSLADEEKEETPQESPKPGNIQFKSPPNMGGPDFTKLLQGFGQIQQLAGQLQELQKVFDATNVSDGDMAKNSKHNK